MSRIFICLCLAAMLQVATVSAAEPEQLTEKQMEQVAGLIAAERERILLEVHEELASHNCGAQAVAESVVDAGNSQVEDSRVQVRSGNWVAIEPPPAPAADQSQVVVATPAGVVTQLSALANEAGVATADKSVRGRESALQIDASAEKTKASIVLVYPFLPEYNPKSNRIEERKFNFSASSPIDKSDEGSASFATLSGAANGLSLGVGYTLSTSPVIEFGGQMKALCRKLNLVVCSDGEIRRVLPLGDNERYRGEYDAIDNLFLKGWSNIYDFHGGVSQDDFKYFMSPAVAKTDTEIQWSLGASFGMTSPARKAYLGAGFDIKRGFKSKKERILCPLSTTDPFECTRGSFGAPSREYGRVAFIEARGAWGRPFSLRLEHDFSDDTSSADLPIYLLRNKSTQFTGGLRLGWSTDDDFIAGIFVGKEFKL